MEALPELIEIPFILPQGIILVLLNEQIQHGFAAPGTFHNHIQGKPVFVFDKNAGQLLQCFICKFFGCVGG